MKHVQQRGGGTAQRIRDLQVLTGTVVGANVQGPPHDLTSYRDAAMQKLTLAMEELVVETFDTLGSDTTEKGTVHAHATEGIDGCTIDVACTRVGSCPVELCWEQQTNDPRQRLCVTPYVECSTQGWTCDYC